METKLWSPLLHGLSLLDTVPPSPLTNECTSVFSFDTETVVSSQLSSDGSHESEFPELELEYYPMVQEHTGLLSDGRMVAKPKQVSTKIFIGGIAPGVTIDELQNCFSWYGKCEVNWPNRSDGEITPPNGYAFVVYETEESALAVLNGCQQNDGKVLFLVAMANGNYRLTELKFWEVKNANCIVIPNWRNYIRLSVFVGGLPRSCTALELKEVFEEEIGQVAHVDIEVDNVTAYPKGAARVVFLRRESYLKAMAMREMILVIHNTQRRVELKPFLYPKMACEHCSSPQGALFCSDIRCLKYFCQMCWKQVHAKPGMGLHEPMRRSPKLNSAKRM
jgi:hypothetical protein